MKTIQKCYDVVVVGGGMAGLCAAISSARCGASTALVHDRPVLGGNASSEHRIHILGADCHASKPNARETGIINEILLENKARNPCHSFAIWDTVLWEKARFQPGLETFLNAYMTDVRTENGCIAAITASQMTNETRLSLSGRVFIDCTGDGTLGALAGAASMTGRESKRVYGEPDAPSEDQPTVTMGSTVAYMAVDKGKPVPFEHPFWAHRFTEEDLAKRRHGVVSDAGYLFGHFWNELGGGKYNTIDDAEEIRDELLKCVYGIWDHIKNGGDHGAENYELEWVEFLPGKRESRRLTGPYVLTENDILENAVFPDGVAFGGWHIDCHTPDSIYASGSPYSQFIHFDGVYGIPYQCLYSVNVPNLMMAGRLISASSLAHGSARVMGTGAVTGQAAGTAAALAVQSGCNPAGVCVAALQRRLFRDGAYIPGYMNRDPDNLAHKAAVSASSEAEGGACGQVTNGVSRPTNGDYNGWISRPEDREPWLELHFPDTVQASGVVLMFDTDLNSEIMCTMNAALREKQPPSTPGTLIRNYTLVLYRGGEPIKTVPVRDNRQHVNRIDLDGSVCFDRLRLEISSTHGDTCARVMEIMVF